MFIRLHTPPKTCRCEDKDEFNPKQRYLFNKSFERYSKTPDGEYITGFVERMKPEIGRVDNVRFYG